MKSIRRWLLGWLIVGLMATSLIAGGAIFHTARTESGELFDYELRTIALSLPANIETADTAEQPTNGYSGIADDHVVIEIWDRQGNRVYQARPEQSLSLPKVEGFSSIEAHGLRWRVFMVRQTDRIVVTAQPFSVRHDLGDTLAWNTLWPLILLIPATILWVLFVVGRGLSPIDKLSALLEGRSVRSFSLLPVANVPNEVRPLVVALNALLQRLEQAAHAQQTFIADAAHELRTPLTALKLQLQAIKRDDTDGDDALSVERLTTRVNRIIHLAQQLLVMAREDAQNSRALVPVSLRQIAESAVAELSLLAEAKQVDLGLESASLAADDACQITGDAMGLSILLNNLIDNAIRHSDAGGKIDVVLSRSNGRMNVDVADTGTGIPPEELERVRDRFYRGESARGQGSGLGLAIVSSVVERHSAKLVLRNRVDGPGLVVSVQGL